MKFDFVMTLPKLFDEKTRICFIEGRKGTHGMLIATHPNCKAIVIDMESKTWREIQPLPRA